MKNNFSINSYSLLISFSIFSFSLMSYSSLKDGFFGSFLSTSSILSIGLSVSMTPLVYFVQFLVGEFSKSFLAY